MNVFFLDRNPVCAAQCQCDKHVVKMVTETAQMLSAVHHFAYTELKGSNKIYRLAYAKHPWTKWAFWSRLHYRWLLAHGIALGQEYTYRYGKIHKSAEVIEGIAEWSDENKFWRVTSVDGGSIKWVPYCVRTEDEYITYAGGRIRRDPVEAYRSYYKYKNTIMDMRWTKREPPPWFTEIHLAA